MIDFPPELAERYTAISSDPYAHMSVAHHFGGGVYMKQMGLEAGFILCTHRHKFDHLSVLMSGIADVDVAGEVTRYTAPAVITIKAHLSHAIRAVTDVTWLCCHATAKLDAEDIDMEFIDG